MATLSHDVPRYHAETSVMSTRNKLNPGLGFRPQIDPEDTLIAYSMNPLSTTKFKENFNKLNRSLNIYLDHYYDSQQSDNDIQDCDQKNVYELRDNFLKNRLYCDYDYEKVLFESSCSPSNSYGYLDEGPCVIVKLNKIYSWTPKPFKNLKALPPQINSSLINNNPKVLKTNILIKCDGEYGSDRDALRNSTVIYYSMGSKELNIQDIGLIPFYYYPYLNQPGYRSPLVFVHFKNLPKNRLINILCKAYAANIDSSDKMNLRGMTNFQLFIES